MDISARCVPPVPRKQEEAGSHRAQANFRFPVSKEADGIPDSPAGTMGLHHHAHPKKRVFVCLLTFMLISYHCNILHFDSILIAWI